MIKINLSKFSLINWLNRHLMNSLLKSFVQLLILFNVHEILIIRDKAVLVMFLSSLYFGNDKKLQLIKNPAHSYYKFLDTETYLQGIVG